MSLLDQLNGAKWEADARGLPAWANAFAAVLEGTDSPNLWEALGTFRLVVGTALPHCGTVDLGERSLDDLCELATFLIQRRRDGKQPEAEMQQKFFLWRELHS